MEKRPTRSTNAPYLTFGLSSGAGSGALESGFAREALSASTLPLCRLTHRRPFPFIAVRHDNGLEGSLTASETSRSTIEEFKLNHASRPTFLRLAMILLNAEIYVNPLCRIATRQGRFFRGHSS